MKLHIAYRIPRKVSDWVLDGYYSEVLVEGHKNVPKDGPLIIAATHPNEIIDVATLAVTIPHRESRFLCFWAKSALFKNPLVDAFIRSSGAIPVKRNLNKTSTSDDMATREALFAETTKVLKRGGVVGLFPEGASYTGWRIFQVMPGAAWSGVEYTLAAGEAAPPVVIVPTAITYTDKSRYASRLYVRYGEPITFEAYRDQLVGSSVDKQASSARIAKEVTAILEQRLQDMSTSAPDWETTCAIKTAKQILFLDEDRIPLSQWVGLDQWLTATLNKPEALETKEALTRYDSLLHHARMHHGILERLAPLSTKDSLATRASKTLLADLPLAIVRFIAFIPPLLVYLPGYLAAFLATKILAHPAEVEAHAQFRAVVGGLGVGAHLAAILASLWSSRYVAASVKWAVFGQYLLNKEWLQVAHGIGAAYIGLRIFSKWHKLLFKANKRSLESVVTCWKLLKSCFITSALHQSKVEPYTVPVYPPVPRWVKADIVRKENPKLSRADPAELVPALLQARVQATSALKGHLARAKSQQTLPEALNGVLLV